MATHRASVLEAFGEGVVLKSIPTPEPKAGEIRVRVLAAQIGSYGGPRTRGKPEYLPMNFPVVLGTMSVGRVDAVGPDALHFKPGQLVLTAARVTARDDHTRTIIQGYYHEFDDKKALSTLYRNGTWAEQVLIPLENAVALPERLLQRAYSFPAIASALAIGARKIVIASRNMEKLKPILAKFPEDGRITGVQIKGTLDAHVEDVATFKKAADNAYLPGGAGFDAFMEMSPAGGTGQSDYIAAAVASLRPYGQALFYGGVQSFVPLHYFHIIFHNITIRGQYMYEPQELLEVVGLVEAGVIRLDEEGGFKTKTWKLDDIQKALDEAESDPVDTFSVVTPTFD